MNIGIVLLIEYLHLFQNFLLTPDYWSDECFLFSDFRIVRFSKLLQA